MRRDDRSFAGAGVALVTPFTKDGALDEAALRRLVRRQVEGGIDVLVPCGTTGESATLTGDEQERVVESRPSRRRGPGAGAGGRGQQRHPEGDRAGAVMAGLGVHGVLSVGPYYNKPTPEGFFRHFGAIADASPVPVVFYNVPGPDGQQHRRPDAAAPGRAPQHRRGEGGLGQPRPDHGDPARPAGGLRGALGRRRLHPGR